MPPTEHGPVRTALLVNFRRNETPTPPSSPVEWVAVPDPNAPKSLWEKLVESCKCDCAGDRSNQPPKCVIS